MKMFLAAAAVMAFGSLGVACASEGPTEDDVVTIDGNEGQTDLSARPPCRAFALRATQRGVKVGERFLVRFAGDPPVVAECTNEGGGGVKDPAPAPLPAAPAPAAPVAAAK
ncbi:MAG: hypothetical protein U0174_23365 [Polyangiaceae bacterium]